MRIDVSLVRKIVDQLNKSKCINRRTHSCSPIAHAISVSFPALYHPILTNMNSTNCVLSSTVPH